ncbi:uncharacterized protein LOC128226024 [Mya arenaria]|uniref:uncharacterized protein LOC128226024 n=1 Tax=Mya arenaria TaxID=6604 RepID=UPI0022E41DD6|nr:uncharacterized protein LOC128226024 [Mya arenaria]
MQEEKALITLDQEDTLEVEHFDLDKGWAWVVLIACFFALCILGNAQLSVGIIHEVLLERHGACLAVTSWAGALNVALVSLTVHGRTVRFCTYEKRRYLPRSSFKDYDKCLKCNCLRNGLFCSIMAPQCQATEPSICKWVRIGCKGYWVLKSNMDKRCPAKQIPAHSCVI